MAAKTNQPQKEKNKDFGLPQDEFKPIESEGGKWFTITAIIVGLVLSMGAGIVYRFFYHAPSTDLAIEAPRMHEVYKRETPETNVDFIDEDVPTIHQSTKKKTQTPKIAKELETLAEAGRGETKKRTRSPINTSKKGTITKIITPRGYYYIVVGSFIDGDLASDYANQLVQQGVNVVLIDPLQGRYFFRVAIEQSNTFHDANKKVAAVKAKYGTDIWVIKY